MKSSSAQAILGAAAAVVLAVAVTGFGGLPLALGTLSAAVALACVALSTQSRRLRDDERLVYRPVYARRQSVQRRVRSDD